MQFRPKCNPLKVLHKEMLPTAPLPTKTRLVRIIPEGAAEPANVSKTLGLQL